MAIGDSYTTTPPAIGTAGPTYAVTINEILTYLIQCVTSTVPFSALSGTNLDMNNVPISEAQYLGFTGQSSVPGASPVNRFESYGGNIYWVGTSGAVQITNGTQLNASALGAIAGDYGGANPASLRFVDADLMYKFYDDFAGLAWAYARVRGLSIANGAAGTVFALLNYAGAGNLTFTLPATLPASNNSVATINSAGQISHNSTGNTITNDIVLGGTTKIQHGDRIIKVVNKTDLISTGTYDTSAGPGTVGTFGAGPFDYMVYIPGLQVNSRIKSVQMYFTKSTASTLTVSLRSKPSVSPYTEVVLFTGTSTTTGDGSITVSGTHTVTNDSSIYYVRINDTDNSADFRSIIVTYDVV